jgi:hypothetical protein
VSRIAVLILYCCLFGQAGSSAAALRLMLGYSVRYPGTACPVLEDPTGTMTLADAQRRAGEFKPSAVRDDAAINFGYSSAAWWLRVDLAAERTRRATGCSRWRFRHWTASSISVPAAND